MWRIILLSAVAILCSAGLAQAQYKSAMPQMPGPTGGGAMPPVPRSSHNDSQIAVQQGIPTIPPPAATACVTPVTVCYLPPGSSGVSCWCTTPNGPIAGVTQ